MAKRLAVVGAGAKAAAIVARVAALRELAVSEVPEIVILEAERIGAAWSGKGRFTSGLLTLCTPGEKDVGFPYNDMISRGGVSAAVSPTLFARFSWNAYLADTGGLAEWVDRGREHPTHRRWAEYLEWVFGRAGQPILQAKVTRVRSTDGHWEISFNQDGQSRRTLVDGIVLTGTGRAKSVPIRAGVPTERVFDADTFWGAREVVLALKEGTIAVVGDGGAAGTIVAWLAERFEERPVSIYSISPMGTLFPRGDGYSERRWFSDPSDWRELSVEHRRKLLERTEAGVVSMRNKRIIDQSFKVEYVRGKAVEVQSDGKELFVDIEYEEERIPCLAVDYLINAIGFDSWGLLELVEHPGVAPLCAPGGDVLRRRVEAEMMADLTLPPISALPAGLHVPALSGLAHGPGMSNLGCLGLMASAVLRRYLTKQMRLVAA